MSDSLYLELLKAHDISATANPNGSLMVALTVYKASGSMTSALAAASLAQGDLHAPIDKARELLHEGNNASFLARDLIHDGFKVPGFGNSFYPDGDPAFLDLAIMLREQRPEMMKIVDRIRDANPKLPQPNAAMYTAMVMEAMDIPVGMGPAIFIAARVKAWAKYLLEHKD